MLIFLIFGSCYKCNSCFLPMQKYFVNTVVAIQKYFYYKCIAPYAAHIACMPGLDKVGLKMVW